MHVVAPTAPRGHSPTPRRPPAWLGDLVAAVMIVLTGFGPLGLFQIPLSVVGVIAVGLPALLMFLRRTYPWIVLVACVAGYVLAAITLVLTPFSGLATGVALYTVSVRASRRTALVTTIAVLAVLVPTVSIHEGSVLNPLTVLAVVMMGFFSVGGDAVRSRRAYIAEITERAVAAEQTREAEASRRVAEERLRIARDLHDTLAHQISIISLNAAVATRNLDTDPETTRTALLGIRTASRRILGETGTFLSTLRSSEDQPSGTQPTAGLEHLDALSAEFDASGLRVTIRVDTALDELPRAVNASGYRILQEALTNAHKHGVGASAHVWIHDDAGMLSLVVTNPATPSSSPSPPPGHGLLGIRERVAALGGTLVSGQNGATYRLEARLPLHGPDPEATT